MDYGAPSFYNIGYEGKIIPKKLKTPAAIAAATTAAATLPHFCWPPMAPGAVSWWDPGRRFGGRFAIPVEVVAHMLVWGEERVNDD